MSDTAQAPSAGIFAEWAPKYWAAGLQAIPLVRGEKGTRVNGWSRYCLEPVPEETRENWLLTDAQGNVGITAGPASGLVFIDIDTTSLGAINAILSVLPPSPWKRIGAKGMVLAYKFGGVGNEKSFQVKDVNGNVLVEFLSTGRQVVAPPSIHPNTKLPYTANADLFDPAVLASVMTLPPGVEGILRGSIEASGIGLSISGHTRVTDWVSRGSRDVQMVAVAGHFASGITKGELTFVEALQRMVAWHSSCTEKIAGHDVDIEKGVRRLAEFVVRDVMGPKQKALPTGWDAGLSDAEKEAFGFDAFDEGNEKWDGPRLKEFLRLAFIQHDVDSEPRMQAVDAALVRLAKSDLDPMIEEQIIRYIIQAGQVNVTPSILRRKIAKLRLGGIEGTDHNQIADAVLAELTAGGPMAWSGGRMWRWGGSHWQTVDEGELLKKIAEGYGHMPAARKQSDHNGILKVMRAKLARELKLVDRHGVNFANGYLTSDLEMLDHNPDDGCTYTLPYRWTPELAELQHSKRFKDFLEDSWLGDSDFEDKRRALQEAMAITLFGVGPRFERAFCLHGPPASGKSQMLRIIAAMVPRETMCAVPPNDWGDKFMPAQLYGKLLNLCGELPEKKLIDGQKFKEIISGEMLTAQHKHGQPFEFRPECSHWFATNHIPKTNDTSSAFNRRWLILTYENPVPLEKRVLDLGTLIVAEERESIAAWAVSIMKELKKAGAVTLPKSHQERIGEIARANNSLRWFLLDSGRVLRVFAGNGSTPARISEQQIYDAYFNFAFGLGGVKPVSLSGFRHAMRELGSELDFRVLVTMNKSGSQDCVYENLTLVSNVKGKSAA
jgi:putative DNA primase/helicase